MEEKNHQQHGVQQQQQQPGALDTNQQAALDHFASLSDAFFLRRDPVAERVLLLVSTSAVNEHGEVHLRKLGDDVAVDMSPQERSTAATATPTQEEIEGQVKQELEILGFHEGKLTVGGPALLKEFVNVKNKRRQQFHRDISASRAKLLRDLFVAPRTVAPDHEQVVSAVQGFVAKHARVLAVGPFAKGLFATLQIHLATTPGTEVEWVLFDSTFLMDDEEYLRDAARLLSQTLGSPHREITPEEATSLHLEDDSRDSADMRRAWKVTLSREDAQDLLKRVSYKHLPGRGTGEVLVDKKKVLIKGPRRENLGTSIYRCCEFL